MRELCYIGLGSNLDSPLYQLELALEALALIPESSLTGASSFYQSAPLGPAGQPDYINAVVALDTGLEPLALLDVLQRIEKQQGRQRTEHWGPRSLDLDLLLYGNRRIDQTRLTIPHPELQKRAFVVLPLLELSPDLVLPDGQPLSRVAALLDSDDLQKLVNR